MLRDVVETDLIIFYRQQLDPESTRMAAFPGREEWTDFLAHWRKILGDPMCRKQTVLWNGQVAGNIGSWPQEGRRLVGYWIGREYWGRGIATAALEEFLGQDRVRPLHALVAAHNVGSIRVLEKCGFVRMGGTMTEHDGVEEYLYRFGQAAAARISGVLAKFLGYDRARRLHVFVTVHNVGWIRVLEQTDDFA